MRRARGFTLVELMVVIAIMSVIMVLAVKAFRKSGSQRDVDNWANELRNQIAQASKRAVATRQPYLIDVRATSVRWCQITPGNFSLAPPWTTTQTTCPAAPTLGVDMGPLVTAPDDAQTALYATSADATAPGLGYAVPSRTALAGSIPLYVGKYSTASTVFANVMSATLPQAGQLGFTLYVRRQGSDETDKRRRVVTYGPSTKTRIVTGY
ncbi:MAG TPA: prepilin-type N-terminal cleavage/methylation domain-containing protein [Polyangia bacterium]|nr:prepilin-type N-terminal cleavage/methylation domain-containing protein [Polyangia bacterium]